MRGHGFAAVAVLVGFPRVCLAAFSTVSGWDADSRRQAGFHGRARGKTPAITRLPEAPGGILREQLPQNESSKTQNPSYFKRGSCYGFYTYRGGRKLCREIKAPWIHTDRYLPYKCKTHSDIFNGKVK